MDLSYLYELISSPSLLFPIAGVTTIFFCVMSLILFHHWRSYTVDPRSIRTLIIVYFTGGVALVGVMLATLIMILA